MSPDSSGFWKVLFKCDVHHEGGGVTRAYKLHSWMPVGWEACVEYVLHGHGPSSPWKSRQHHQPPVTGTSRVNRWHRRKTSLDQIQYRAREESKIVSGSLVICVFFSCHLFNQNLSVLLRLNPMPTDDLGLDYMRLRTNKSDRICACMHAYSRIWAQFGSFNCTCTYFSWQVLHWATSTPSRSPFGSFPWLRLPFTECWRTVENISESLIINLY